MIIERLIDKIKSPYILKKILNYISNKQLIIKLFLYSKKYQKKFGLHFNKLKKEYLSKIGFDINKYLCIEPKFFTKDYLTNEYQKFLKQKRLNKTIFENIIYDIFEYKKIKNIEKENVETLDNYGILINVYSPLFNIISKTKSFEKIFKIQISQENIDKYNLKDDYITFFKNLNNLNIQYTWIVYILNDISKIKYLKELDINLNIIKNLTLRIEKDENNDYVIENKIKFFFTTIFSINNLEKNLVYLNLQFIKEHRIPPDLFEKINNFKSLKYLYLQLFHFKQNFKIKLNSLKLLSLHFCKNIVMPEYNENLEALDLGYNYMLNIKFLEKKNYEKLEILDLNKNRIFDINRLDHCIFKGLKKLYLSSNKISDISILEKVNFEELIILDLKNNEISNIKTLEKVNFKKLKILDLQNNYISDINVLGKVNFKELQLLDLQNNFISDIKVLEKVTFPKLEELYLNHNRISTIKVLEKVNLPKLVELYLNNNKISNIKSLKKIKFKESMKICLDNNKFKNNS